MNCVKKVFENVLLRASIPSLIAYVQESYRQNDQELVQRAKRVPGQGQVHTSCCTKPSPETKPAIGQLRLIPFKIRLLHVLMWIYLKQKFKDI